MTDIDSVLVEMRAALADVRLAATEDIVLGRASARRARVHGQRNLLATGLLALGAGVIANIALPQGAEAEAALTFTAAPPTAPSNLLFGAR
ncbi:hypothetical protein KX816_17620 [Sphingosinicellaceae bacterium]|nr:hypothetical protein KX816_17620 [Sphingosinicellaceae bacterium]